MLLSCGITLPSLCDRDTGPGVGFLLGFTSESDTGAAARHLLLPAQCPDDTDTGSGGVLPAATWV